MQIRFAEKLKHLVNTDVMACTNSVSAIVKEKTNIIKLKST